MTQIYCWPSPKQISCYDNEKGNLFVNSFIVIQSSRFFSHVIVTHIERGVNLCVVF